MLDMTSLEHLMLAEREKRKKITIRSTSRQAAINKYALVTKINDSNSTTLSSVTKIAVHFHVQRDASPLRNGAE
jgi:hypothetical protein